MTNKRPSNKGFKVHNVARGQSIPTKLHVSAFIIAEGRWSSAMTAKAACLHWEHDDTIESTKYSVGQPDATARVASREPDWQSRVYIMRLYPLLHVIFVQTLMPAWLTCTFCATSLLWCVHVRRVEERDWLVLLVCGHSVPWRLTEISYYHQCRWYKVETRAYIERVQRRHDEDWTRRVVHWKTGEIYPYNMILSTEISSLAFGTNLTSVWDYNYIVHHDWLLLLLWRRGQQI